MDDIETVVTATTDDPLDMWAFIEVMGHSKIAGRLTTRKVGVNVLLQVDVCNPEGGFKYSKLYNPSSVFSITPTNEEWCRRWSRENEKYSAPVLPYIPAPDERLKTEPLKLGDVSRGDDIENPFEEDDEEDGYGERNM